MAELIGEVCIPSELVLPKKTGNFKGKAGTIFLSGAKLYFNPTAGASAELITSV